jgi:hypothetical protein
VPVGVAQRDARVGDRVQLSHRGVVAQERVLAGVVDDQRPAGHRRVPARGMGERRAVLGPALDPVLAGERLLLGADQRDRDRTGAGVVVGERLVELGVGARASGRSQPGSSTAMRSAPIRARVSVTRSS